MIRMRSCYYFNEDEIRIVSNLQNKWEMSEVMLSYLDTY